jgi:hypothetical protein
MKLSAMLLLTSLVFSTGCQSSSKVRPEKGPQGTIAYEIALESSEAGARVEVNGDYVGKTPISVKVFGDRDGTFHNFGTDDYVIKVFPVSAGQKAQTKIFRTGRWFGSEDRIPSRLYFDLNSTEEGFSIDLPNKANSTNKTP